MYYINDKVKENFNESDYFDGKSYVKKIKDAIKNNNIKSIGVYGKWGIGKTSIIKNSINELIKEGKYKANQVVEYNAWKYNKYDFMRDFLIVCSNKIEGEKRAKEREESYYSDNSEDIQLYVMLWKKFWTFLTKSWKVLLVLFIMYILAIIGILYINNLRPLWFDCADLITPLTLTLIGFILPLFLVSEISHKSISKKFSPEQFARDFEEIVNGKKILIFIDDIDRCSYEEIKSTFDTLKTFILDENYDVKFIIPVDPNILFNSLDEQTYDYFSKIIDYPIEIKNYTKVKFEPLKEEILKDVLNEYKKVVSDGLYLASKFYIDTPRKMKKFANEFINEIYGYKSNEISDKGYMFAKLIILKNEFPNYYYNLIKNYKSVIDLTEEEIVNYQTRDYIDSKKQKKGIIFSVKLLDFLNKTNNVDLYNFPLYEYKISYAEYKIKALCEDPILKNKFEEEMKIDLMKNEKCLKYEFEENIIFPLSTGKLLYGDLLKRIIFVVLEFRKQKNNSVFDKYYDQIILNFNQILKDHNLYVEEKTDEKNVRHLNIKYIYETLEEYSTYLKQQNDDLLNDKLIVKILKLINDNLENDFSYIEEDLISFVQLFNKSINITDISLINILEKYLNKNFNRYHNEFLWYFESSPDVGTKCYVGNILELIKSNELNNEEILKRYLENRYSKMNMKQYLANVEKNIEEIVNSASKYYFIMEPLINCLKGEDIEFEVFEQIINKTKLISNDETLNKFILKILEEMKKSKNLDEEKYHEHLANIGSEYNNSAPINYELKKFILKCNSNNKNIILGYNEDKNIFTNFKLIKKYGDIFPEKNSNIFKTLSKTYCEFEDYVIPSDLENNGFNLNDYKEEIKELNKIDLVNTIYLDGNFSEEEINDIDFELININEIKLKHIQNKYLISKIVNQLKKNIDSCIKNIKSSKENKELVRSEIDKLLLNSNKLYGEMEYNDKTLWTKLKMVNEYLALNELIDVYYIPKLKEYPNLIKLFSEGKYKDNYLKDNIFADKILKGIGIKKDE